MPGILPWQATAVNGCRRTFGYRSALPRPLVSRRSAAVTLLVSPDDAAPSTIPARELRRAARNSRPLAPSAVRQVRGQRLGQVGGHVRLGDDRVAAGGERRGTLLGHHPAGD